MTVDEALLIGFREGDLPILRLYGWEPSLSAGRFSNLHHCVDLERVTDRGLSCVRRMSGGGVLVHGGDLSYALILPRTLLPEKGVKENYRILCGFLIRLYGMLGYKADFACDADSVHGHSDICLAANEANDILINGEKTGGNAQRYTREVLFQHGSIPMSLNEELFDPLFLKESGIKEASSLQKLGVTMTYEALSGMVREAFCATFGSEIISDTLTLREKESAQELFEGKYTKEGWNLHGQNIYP
jgi:lipoate-protein ligase A